MKKGFTLIELLALIIILAIVALIATPIVLDVVNDAKNSAAKSEASMIVSGVNNYCAASAMKEQLNGTTDICKDGVTAEEVKTMVDLGNAKINSITYADGKVTSLEVESNDKTVKYNGTVYSIDGEDTPEEPQVTAYYAFGKPDETSSTDYQTIGKRVFARKLGNQLGVCILKNNSLECFNSNNVEYEQEHLKTVYGESNCQSNSYQFYCENGGYIVYIHYDGMVRISGSYDCRVYTDGTVTCTNLEIEL